MTNALFEELKEIDEKIIKIENDIIKTTHSRKAVRVIDRTILVASIIGPATTVPQIWQIFASKSAQGVSFLTWLAYLVFTLLWLVYAIAHRDKALFVNNILWILFELVILAGILIY